MIFSLEKWLGKAREIHAQRVKISRENRSRQIPSPRFVGIFAKKSVGIGGAKEALESALAVSNLSVKVTDCRLNKTKNKSAKL